MSLLLYQLSYGPFSMFILFSTARFVKWGERRRGRKGAGLLDLLMGGLTLPRLSAIICNGKYPYFFELQEG
ncbi:MAG: hypothetical protein C4520_10360 [Candidatus Abyssobacteria bacterium SURF_5]|uniref:Uncharacterized protein n=1 Tax=Abyssobacteria bacterium (strain SURF_5) TaxID=2093360 RepID=A0A3A4NQ12_ABYX5|nr:MAG: hypothetical protein C4520_10360 [Candidatus Abyssubacteria bacterium SURF_5]